MAYDKKRSLIIDTGFFLSLADSRDLLHTRALKLAKKYQAFDWITTLPVITETCHMLSNRSSVALLKEQIKGLFEIYPITEKDHLRIIDLMEKYGDREIDLADVSLIILAEHLDHGNILSCDQRDFSTLKWKNTKSFHNLFFV